MYIEIKLLYLVLECQRKWANLRDTFRHNFKAQNMPSGSGAAKKIKWVHFDAMKFLVPFIETPRQDKF